MPPDTADLIVSEVGRTIRRSVSPWAWVVLEEVAIGPTDDAGVVATNVRQLAADTGFNKDTIARALRELSESGLVVRVERDPSNAGCFCRTGYWVDLGAAGLDLRQSTVAPTLAPTESSSTSATADAKPAAPRRSSSTTSTQLSLLDL
jgi:hypothetical protein